MKGVGSLENCPDGTKELEYKEGGCDGGMIGTKFGIDNKSTSEENTDVIKNTSFQ